MSTTALGALEEISVVVRPSGGSKLEVTCSDCGSVGTYQIPEVAEESRRWHLEKHAGAYILRVRLTRQQYEWVAAEAARARCTPQQFILEVLAETSAVVHSKHSRMGGLR